MKRCIPMLVLVALCVSALAADVKLSWFANPADQQITGYILYRGSVVTGPFTAITNVATTNVTLSLNPGQYFFFVTASNFWGESLPSNKVSTPPVGSNVTGVTITR